MIAVSNNVWIVPSPFTSKYIEAARKKSELVSERTKLYIYEADKDKALEEVLDKAIEDMLKRVGRG